MNLSDFQKAEGLNLTQLASRLGFAVSTVHGWISGGRKPEVDLLERISVATGGKVHPADLRPDLAELMAHRRPTLSKQAAA